MKRNVVWLAAALLPLTACDLDLTGIDVDCNYRDSFSDVLDARTSTAVRIVAETGDLQVVGRAGLNEVRVRGDACAEDRRDLDDIEMVVQRSGSTIRVLGLVPSGSNIRARLDLIVEVPDWMLVDIDHRDGNIEVESVAGLAIFDDAGNIWIENIDGDVEINDDSGELQVNEVFGDLYLWDESGNVNLRRIHGSVIVDYDGSGNLDVSNVGFDVYIAEDASGDIFVEDIRGDFTVVRDASGSITYRNVGGRITVPR
jgi:hypothetical protein